MRKILSFLLITILLIFTSCEFEYGHVHDFSNLIPRKEATCTTDGEIEHYYCSECKGYFDDDKNAVKSIKISATGHNMIKNPTSTDYICDEVKHTLKCQNPGCSYKVDGNHIQGSVVKENVVSATSIKNGSHDDVVYCTICNYELSRTTTIDKYIDPSHVHTYGTLHNEVPATCNTTGTIAYYYCDDCDNYFDAEYNLVNSIVIPMVEHDYLKDVGKTVITYTCKYCGDSYTDATVKKLEVYAVNDYHGKVNSSDSTPLIAFGSYFKEVNQNENTILLDQGDTWQGTLESNYNRGRLINDVMNYVGFDARTIGNHDFDWGIENLKANTARGYNGYNMTTLAANVYDYNFKTKVEGNIQQSDIGVEYKVIESENGLKVGVIGVIGSDQITSITSQYVESICFKNHIQIIKNVSDYLRVSLNCDVIICSIHADEDDVLSTGITKVSSVSNQRYVDLVLCAHSHQEESSTENGVLFVQGSGYGSSFNHVTLTYDAYANKITGTNKVIKSSTVKYNYTEDAEVKRIIDEYSLETKDLGNEKIIDGVDGTFYSGEQLANLMCEAMYKEASKEGFNVDYAYCNTARASIYTSNWTYSTIYNSFPFDNTVYIIQVTGKVMKNEVQKYNNIYRGDTTVAKKAIVDDQLYVVACLDYLAFHVNSYRYYDYFPKLTVLGYLQKDNEIYNYRDILTDYLRGIESAGNSISSDNYESGYHFDRSLMSESY